MNRLQYVFVFFALLLFLAPVAKAQGTYTAKSCSYSNVNAVINGPTHTAVNGDTINIPAGTCAWSSTLDINVAITLQGAGAVSSTSWVPGTGTTTTGTDQTVINPAVGGNSTVIVNTSLGNPEMRITGIAFLEDSGSGNTGGGIVHLNGNANNVRIDHCHFYTSQSSKVILIGGSVTGVADHNFMDILVNTIGFFYSFYNGIGWNGISDPNGYGDPSYADGDNWGTSKFFYVEDNYLDGEGTGAGSNGNYVTDCVNGGRGVIRYSTAVNTQGNASHGLSGGANRGCRAMEVYMNYYSYSPNHACCIVHPNSGTAMVWGNFSAGMGNIVDTQMERILSNEGRDAEELIPAPDGWGYCGTAHATGTATVSSTSVTGTGFSTAWPAPFNMIIPGAQCTGAFGTLGNVCKVTHVISSTSLILATPAEASVSGVTYSVGSPWDGGTNSEGYPCLDAPGRGISDLLNGLNFPRRADTVSPLTQRWPNQALSPIYVWDNTYSPTGTGGQGIFYDGTGTLADNRDYYMQFGTYGEGGSFNGTAGVGQGSSLPSDAQPTCTPSSNHIAASGFPISGNWGPGYWDTTNSTLYICTAPNTWTAYYTPYTYPHPLIAGSGGSGGDPPPNAPTGLSATVQ